MHCYFLNFLFSALFLQIQTRQEVVQTYYILQALTWLLIISALLIFSFFAFLLIKKSIHKSQNKVTH